MEHFIVVILKSSAQQVDSGWQKDGCCKQAITLIEPRKSSECFLDAPASARDRGETGTGN
jgi:hypothetical protein